MANISTFDTWSTTAASNQPDSTDSATIQADLQAIQAEMRKNLGTKGADIASATTTDLSTATGNIVDVTGTTTITGLGTLAAGLWKIVRFTGALTLTHNATSLILPGAANITTANGDVMLAYSLGSGNWKVAFYERANGSGVFSSITDTGNFTLSGTGARITGDFSNATLANRVAFKTNTTNGATRIGIIPNGTATDSDLKVFNGADPDNASNISISIDNAATYVSSSKTGTGTYLPMNFYTNGSGQLSIGTDGVATFTQVPKCPGYATRNGTTGSYSGASFNINHTTGQQLWIDTTNMGTIAYTSDYRIKKNVVTQALPALARLQQLRPVTFQFDNYAPLLSKADGVDREGFIAHEVQAIIPSAVEGEKDAPNQVQSLGLDALMSVMVKAIQELKAEVDDLRSRLPV